MQPAALGVTCKDALNAFSQNETLALQRRVAELEARLAKFEPVEKVDRFNTPADFVLMKATVVKLLAEWLKTHIVNVNGMIIFKDAEAALIEVVKEAVALWTGKHELGDHVAWLCFEVVKDCEFEDDWTARDCREHIFGVLLDLLDKYLYKIGASNFCQQNIKNEVTPQLARRSTTMFDDPPE